MKRIIVIGSILIMSFFVRHVYAEDEGGGTVPPMPASVYLPVIAHNPQPTATNTPTNTPTSVATATNTSTPTKTPIPPTPTKTPTPTRTPKPTATPDVPRPYDNDPKQVALRPGDLPSGWIIEEDGYESLSQDDLKKKHVISAYYSWYRNLNVKNDVISVGGYITKYKTPEDASAGFGRGIKAHSDDGWTQVNWPTLPDIDQQIVMTHWNGYYQFTVLIVRKGNFRAIIWMGWRRSYNFDFNVSCGQNVIGRITGVSYPCDFSIYPGAVVAANDESMEPLDHLSIPVGEP